MKWCIVTQEDFTSAYRALSEYLQQLGFENEFQIIKPKTEEFALELKALTTEMDQVRVGSPFGELINKVIQRKEAWVTALGASDSYVKVAENWWPRSALYSGLNDMLRVQGQFMDPRSAVLVVGAGAAARVAISAFLRLGFRQVLLADRKIERAEGLAANLRRQLVGVDFKVVPVEELILLPGSHGVLINTTPFSGENSLLSELYYFNFLKPGGMVWDFSLWPVETPLLSEAKDIGIKTVSGYQIRAALDYRWCEWILPSEAFARFDLEQYSERIRQTLVQGP